MNEPPKIEAPRPPKSPNLKSRENATEERDTTFLSQINENARLAKCRYLICKTIYEFPGTPPHSATRIKNEVRANFPVTLDDYYSAWNTLRDEGVLKGKAPFGGHIYSYSISKSLDVEDLLQTLAKEAGI